MGPGVGEGPVRADPGTSPDVDPGLETADLGVGLISPSAYLSAGGGEDMTVSVSSTVVAVGDLGDFRDVGDEVSGADRL